MHAGATSAPAPASASAIGTRQSFSIPAGNAEAAARLQASPRKGEFVKVAYQPGSADTLMLWISYPQTRNRAPVIVVIHDNQGLSTWVRAVADQLAADGFVAVAPDLVSKARGDASSVELSGDSVRKIIGSVDFAQRNQGIAAAAGYAMSLPVAERRYGIVGYCWGGSTSFNHAVFNGPGLTAAVAYYGLPYMSGAVPVADSLAKIKVPVMLLNGSRDTRISAAMPAADSLMRALGKTYTSKNYEGAAHGFLRSQTDSANVEASKDAWPRTIAFFRTHLGVK